ncbi:class I SAM-dependent methyltransferase [Trichocoleus sp. FACHB-591]|uniref:class I SAM-dependent methyltransferase n=1 Tax=Trichocoleus sp. FACHB-591 TaxID=2692872 RepID=UPI00168985DA|nr:class I SAM-dependent methyltransferase [Trichocoleus sp. FACHB-591]MBD2093925.1 class I SAM-dependent methyltransferase [Trichocoleus sp. FACHB-591]
MIKSIYENKESSYFTTARQDIISLLPVNKKYKILEVGAGSGETLLLAKNLDLAEEVVGIELLDFNETRQVNPKIDRFIFGNIESMELDFEEEYFDVIICADVLEHLVDPWSIVKKLSNFLKKEGFFISSIPNVRNYKILFSIFFNGDFKYQEGGILDRTHLRFFCKQNIVHLFKGNGYCIEKISNNMGGYGLKQKLFNAMTFGILRDFFVFQYCTVARKKLQEK